MTRRWFRNIFVIFSTSRRCSRKRSSSFLPVLLCGFFRIVCRLCSGDASKSIIYVDGLFRPGDIGGILDERHHDRVYSKVPGWLLKFCMLLARKLHIFWSRLKDRKKKKQETSGAQAAFLHREVPNVVLLARLTQLGSMKDASWMLPGKNVDCCTSVNLPTVMDVHQSKARLFLVGHGRPQ